jgi:hypothetical protein
LCNISGFVAENTLTKLHFYGIQGIAEKWFRSCLTDRKQKVEIKSSKNHQHFLSNWGKIKHGVSQGSILGPWFP